MLIARERKVGNMRRASDNSAVAKRNLNHALAGNCTDPDCEIHMPSVIEDRGQRLTALAWFIAGAMAAQDSMEKHNVRAMGKLSKAVKEL